MAAERVDTRAALIVRIATAKRQTGRPLECRALLAGALASLPDHDGVDALTLRVELALGCCFAGRFAEMPELAAALLRTARARRCRSRIGSARASSRRSPTCTWPWPCRPPATPTAPPPSWPPWTASQPGPLLDLSAGRGWELLVDTHLDLGDLDAAGDAARAETRSAADRLPQLTATAQRALAGVALARGDVAGAADVATAATAGAQRAGNPLLAACARALAGTALVAQGARQRGIAELHQAHETLLACGARREADAAARELRRLGRRVARPPRAAQGTGLRALSAREREVADRVASGKTNRSIAADLFLSEKTIESHLSRIYDKLELRSRVALAALIAREGDRDV